MKQKYTLILVLIVIVLLAGYKLYVNKQAINRKNTPQVANNIKIPVLIDTVSEQITVSNLVKTGNVAPFQEASVSATGGGTLTKFNVELGDHVQQGQVLAQLDAGTIEINLRNSETNETKLKNDLQTYTELLNGKAATQEQVNGIRQNYLNAKSQSDQLRKQLSDTRIKAPISGIVSAKSILQGEVYSPGREIARIINLAQAKVQVFLTEKEVYRVKEGQPVKISTDVYPGQVFEGRVSFISPQSDASHSYLTEIRINNTQKAVLRSGTFVYADFSTQSQQQVLTIPREAIIESIQAPAVYILDNNRAKLRYIKVGHEIEGRVEVQEGLKKGELVVVSGQINLQDGTQVSITNAASQR
ncbi:RND family efflux transporter, MFP subunit [bacterium A37T11]|nr:RND family efflux transporter, MFP subunit [bacterium A37T11]